MQGGMCKEEGSLTDVGVALEGSLFGTGGQGSELLLGVP